MLNKRETAQIFKHYMGQYFVKPDLEYYHYFQERFETAENAIYCYGTRYTLKQCGLAFLDYKENYKQHTQINSYELIDRFLHLGDNNKDLVFYDFPPSPLIIYHTIGTTDNKRLMPLIKHTLSYRELQKQKTVVLTELPIKDVILDKITPVTDVSTIQDIINLTDNDIYGD